MCSFLVWKKRVFELSWVSLWRWPRGVVPHTWYLSAQSFIRLLKLVCRENDIVAMNEWKKNCVGLQRTWVSKRTVNIGRTKCRPVWPLPCWFWHPLDLSMTLKVTSWGKQCTVFIGTVVHNTTKNCLKRVGHGGYEWLEKEMCRFAEDMS